ncbi:hypothetical protein [Desertivirga brevis]|uniref:hypothetical protein n=1 Tax=Desertivirga brevis TaxID=2810310 RepID=UPI001A95FEF9|nr:hypothetical protein [Pedobacter sp. SYSU D00873]
MTGRKVHYVSGLTVSIFITFHLLNHLSSIYGAGEHIAVMNTMRFFYRNPLAEGFLLLAVLAQIISGMRLFMKNRKTAGTTFEKLQIWTGLYLAIFYLVHLAAVFGGRYLLHLDTNFYFGVAGLNSFPTNLFFIPYYGFALFSFFGHLAAIHNRKMKHTIIGLSPAGQSIVILLSGIILSFAIFYGLTNRFNGVAIPKEYDVLIGK